MKYIDLRHNLQFTQPFSSLDIKKFDPDFYYSRLTEWQKKGYIKKIIKGYYIFSDLELNEPTLFRIANQIYNPSYISLETALSYYNIIPEGVYAVTSVTTRENQILESELVNFHYRSVRDDLFWGYKIVGSKMEKYKIATLEKAILDYIYLNKGIKNREDIEGLRFNNNILRESLDLSILNQYLENFKNKRVHKMVRILKEMIENL